MKTLKHGFLMAALGVLNGYSALQVPLEVSNWAETARTGEPVTAGVPLPKGAVADVSRLRILDASGVAVPAQFRPLSRWYAEKFQGLTGTPSVKWVLCDFQADVPAKNRTAFTLEDNAGAAPAPVHPVTITQDANSITVFTGPLKFTISKQSFDFLHQLWLDTDNDGQFSSSEQLMDTTARNGGIITAGDWPAGGCVDNTPHYSFNRPPDRVLVEEEGALKTTIRVEGRHFTDSAGITQGLYGYQVFITAYAGKPYLDVQWAVTNLQLDGDTPAELRSGIPYMTYVWPFKEYKIDMHFNLGATQTYGLSTPRTVEQGSLSGSGVRLLQMPGAFSINGLAKDRNALGGAMIAGTSASVLVAIRDFAPNAPKAIALDKDRMCLELFPDTGASALTSEYWLDPFTRKNHRMRLSFAAGPADAQALSALSQQANSPLRMLAPAAWYQGTRAWYRGFGIPDSRFARHSPSTWTRLYSADSALTAPLDENFQSFGPATWKRWGMPGSFNCAGDHGNLTSVFCKYLLTGNPEDFESQERFTQYFNDLVRTQFSFATDPWVKLNFWLNMEQDLNSVRQAHPPVETYYNYNSNCTAFPGWEALPGWSRLNFPSASPDLGHTTQLELMEYYQLTGDLPTLDAMKGLALYISSQVFGYTYCGIFNSTNWKVADLDSIQVVPWGPRYIARPGIVIGQAFECSGEERFLRAFDIAMYSLRNIVRRSPIGDMGLPAYDGYLPSKEECLAFWQIRHPSDTVFPVSFATHDFQTGIGLEALYYAAQLTGNPGFRDALHFGAKSLEWRMMPEGFPGTYPDYLYQCLPGDSLATAAWKGSFYGSASEALGGVVFGYLSSGRSDFWNVIAKAQPSFPHPDAWYPNITEMKILNMCEAQYRHDSLDCTPPAAIQDLEALSIPGVGVQLQWTAPGDNGATGQAAEYEIKVSKAPIVEMPQRWNEATQTGWPDLLPPLPYTADALLLKAKNYLASREISFWAVPNTINAPGPKTAGTVEQLTLTDLDDSADYHFAIVAYDEAGNSSALSNVPKAWVRIERKGADDALPVLDAFPNPFNPATTIRFYVSKNMAGQAIQLGIYDVRGRLVRMVRPAPGKPGLHRIAWDSRNDNGVMVGSGLYLCRLSYGEKKAELRLILMK